MVLRSMKAIDLFCGAGGAAMGLHRAGFEIEGWDIKESLNYPFCRHVGDALNADLEPFDFVWASPPCQAHSLLRHRVDKEYDCLIEKTRQKLVESGKPYIIENVVGAPLLNPVMVCGSALHLDVRRHRIFESNLPLLGTLCRHDIQPDPIDVSGQGYFQYSERKKKTGGKCRKPKSLSDCRQIMDMPWASRIEISQAIPPAFSEYLGLQVRTHILFKTRP